MDSEQWLSSSDPAAMLAHVQGKVSARKLRLFAVACCRSDFDGKLCPRCGGSGGFPSTMDIGYSDDCFDCHGTGRVGGLTEPRSRAAVEVAERFADGGATKDELARAREALPRTDDPAFVWQGQAVINCVFPDGWRQAEVLSEVMTYHKLVPPASQAALLRDLVNPWHAPNVSWVDGGCRQLAGVIYADRDFSLLPILADRCEEAGCADGILLAHLRGGGVHVRGCHVVDLLTGRE